MVGPKIFGWAWALFAAAAVWWLALIIAVAMVGGALSLCWVVHGSAGPQGVCRGWWRPPSEDTSEHWCSHVVELCRTWPSRRSAENPCDERERISPVVAVWIEEIGVLEPR